MTELSPTAPQAANDVPASRGKIHRDCRHQPLPPGKSRHLKGDKLYPLYLLKYYMPSL